MPLNLPPIAPIPTWAGALDPRIAATNSIGVTANRAVFAAFHVLRPITVANARVVCTSQSGNVDIGIYDAAGTRLGSTGSVAAPAANTAATIPLTAPVTLQPGTLYFAAFATDVGTSAFSGTSSANSSLGTHAGTANLSHFLASSFPLPASVTFNTGQGISACYAVVFTA